MPLALDTFTGSLDTNVHNHGADATPKGRELRQYTMPLDLKQRYLRELLCIGRLWMQILHLISLRTTSPGRRLYPLCVAFPRLRVLSDHPLLGAVSLPPFLSATFMPRMQRASFLQLRLLLLSLRVCPLPHLRASRISHIPPRSPCDKFL